MRRAIIAVASIALASFIAVAPATARVDAGPGDNYRTSAMPRWSDSSNCPLQRIDTQLVKCDNLTGAGVEAPVWVPEYRVIP